MPQRDVGIKTVKGGIVSIAANDPTPKIIAFRYNPSALKRELQPQMVGGEEGDRSIAVRFTGAPVQTINIEVELDASDQLGAGDSNAEQYGLLPQLATLELLIYPTSQQINQMQAQLNNGIMEVGPLIAPRTLFVWGSKRTLPVRLGSYSINEEIFDSALRPIRATVTLSMRVLTYLDVDASNPDYNQFMAYQQTLESMAATIS